MVSIGIFRIEISADRWKRAPNILTGIGIICIGSMFTFKLIMCWPITIIITVKYFIYEKNLSTPQLYCTSCTSFRFPLSNVTPTPRRLPLRFIFRFRVQRAMYIEMYNNNVCVCFHVGMYYTLFSAKRIRQQFGNDNLLQNNKFFLVGTLNFFDFPRVFPSVSENFLL